MTDLVYRMSINYYLEQRKKMAMNENENLSVKRELVYKSNFLTEEMVNELGHLGFSVQQIWNAFKEYKFATIEEAVYIMMKDLETKKYHHKFLKIEIKEEISDDSVINVVAKRESNSQNICGICGEGQYEHVDYLMDNQHDQTSKNKENIIKQIEISPQLINELEDDTLCRICFTNKINPLNNKEKLICGHVFCVSCIENHLTTRITNGKVKDIKCLSAGCIKFFTKEEIKAYVKSNIYSKYVKFYNNQIKFENNDNREIMIINCPHPDCEEVEEYEINSKLINFECVNGHRFCVKCKNEIWHEDDKCTRSEELLLQQLKDNNNINNIKLCPNCNILIEKDDGCNQMKCILCNFEFCWICLSKYEPLHFAIYNFRGCPGMRYYTKKKKDCWSNPFLKFLWFLLSFFIGFIVVCVIILLFFFVGCPYEFIKCYLEKKDTSEEDEEVSEVSNYSNNHHSGQRHKPNNNNNEAESESEDTCTFSKILVCILLAILGIFLQPLYLLFYLLYGMMECYRRFNCWYFYI